MHKNTFFKLLALIGLLLGLCVPKLQVHSQRVVTLESVDITLLPEIDPASLYVIYDITIAKNTPLPQELVIELPPGVTNFIVTNLDVNNLFQKLETTILQSKNKQELQFYALSHTFRVEYLDPNFRQEGAIRNYQFQWQSNYIVESLEVIVRLPEGSKVFDFQPPLREIEEDNLGFTYYRIEPEKISPNETFSLMFWYENISKNPSVPASRVQPVDSITNETLGRSPSPIDLIVWLLMGAAAVVISIILYYLWFRNCVLNNNKTELQGIGISNPEKQAGFCHQCGMRSKPGDAYCQNCGTELRQALLTDE
jgi:hypothetical protein